MRSNRISIQEFPCPDGQGRKGGRWKGRGFTSVGSQTEIHGAIGTSASTQYDVLVVGTSPLSLLEAVTQAQKGFRVCIVERDDRIGGAWKTEDCLDLKGIETTPHVFLPEGGAYNVLDRYLASNFRTLDLKPRLLVKRRGWFFKDSSIPLENRMRMGLALALALHWDGKKHGIAKRLLRSADFVVRRLRDIFRQPLAPAAMYPEGGLTVWFDAVLQILKNRGVHLMLNSQVKSISQTNGAVQVVLAGGRNLFTSRVVLNKHVQFEALDKYGKPIPVECRARVSHHYTFVTADAPPGRFVQTAGQFDIMLINDVSDYSPGLGKLYPGCRLITLRTNSQANHHKAEPDVQFAALKTMGYLPQRSRLIRYHHREITERKLTKATIATLKRTMGPSVKFLVTHDLGIMSTIARVYG